MKYSVYSGPLIYGQTLQTYSFLHLVLHWVPRGCLYCMIVLAEKVVKLTRYGLMQVDHGKYVCALQAFGI